jgi:hypothetical protein
VRWCLDPSRIAGFENDQLIDLVSPNRKSRGLRQRLHVIQELAVNSIGCEMGEGAAFEAKIMVDGLREIRRAIKSTDYQIQDVCRRFRNINICSTIPGFVRRSPGVGGDRNPFRLKTGNRCSRWPVWT